jgi:peptidoglycan/xylan/chitin deacetylase (PgdA/CDA1 family)
MMAWSSKQLRHILPILLYHRVGPEHAGTVPGLNIVPEVFEQQVRWLKRNSYSTITPSDWLEWLRRAKPLPPKPIILNFDDGYADTDNYALPILWRYGFTATIYVVTEEIGGINRWDHAQDWAALPLMSVDQIRHWVAKGFEFGAHSRNHPHLTTLSRSELIDQIRGSASDLSQIIGKPVSSFAYPYGEYDQEVTRVVERNFDTAMTCDPGLNCLSSHPALLRRIIVRPTHSILDFALTIKFGRNPLSRMRSVLRPRTRARKLVNMRW